MHQYPCLSPENSLLLPLIVSQSHLPNCANDLSDGDNAGELFCECPTQHTARVSPLHFSRFDRQFSSSPFFILLSVLRYLIFALETHIQQLTFQDICYLQYIYFRSFLPLHCVCHCFSLALSMCDIPVGSGLALSLQCDKRFWQNEILSH